MAKGVRRGALLLLIATAFVPKPAAAHQRDTLGRGDRTYFVENRGQWDCPARFRAVFSAGTFFAERQCFTVTLAQRDPHHNHQHGHSQHDGRHRTHSYRLVFVGADTLAGPEAASPDEAGGYDNYYLGNDPKRWATGLKHYMTLLYRGLYPGIDMDVRLAENAMKTNFYVAPHASPQQVVMRYDGVQSLFVREGNLIVRTSVTDLVELKPYAYQESDTGRRTVEVRYEADDKEPLVRFAVGDYDPELPLVIDPELIFSTYTGSESDNWGTTATYDSYRNTYTAGLVFGDGYPTSLGAYCGTYNGSTDIGIFKFDTSGSQRLYATYLGGRHADMPHSLYVNSFDELVLFGSTGSPDFPVTEGAYDTSFNGGTRLMFEGGPGDRADIPFPNGSDIFVSRFSEDGTTLPASTYVGGTGNDGLNYFPRFNRTYSIMMQGNDSLYYNYGDGARGELVTDDQNNVYVGSTTVSDDFPTTAGCIMSLAPYGQNGVVFKLDYNLRNMIWSTYLGGIGPDAVYSIDVDSSYNVVACGGTGSINFPVTDGAYQTHYGGGSADGFVSKISYNGEQLIASTYYGSAQYDQCYFVRCGRRNDVFIYGQTTAPDSTMIYNAGYGTPGSGMLLARLYPDLDRREWSTVFGTALGTPNLSPTAFAADLCDRVYAAGWGRDFVGYNGTTWRTRGTTGMETTHGAYQTDTDGQDFYIMSLSVDASTLDYATFFGEIHEDNSYGGADHVDGGTSRFDKHSTLYQSACASCGGTQGFPTTSNVWSDSNLSYNCNNALFRININRNYALAEFAQPEVGCAPYEVQFRNTGLGETFEWDFGDGSSSSNANPQHTYTTPGTYTVSLIATLPMGCIVRDTFRAKVLVLDPLGTSSQVMSGCSGTPLQIGPTPMQGCTYRWIAGEVSDSTVANPYVTSSGTYILRISNGVCSENDTFEVVSHRLCDGLRVTPPTCPGGSDGRVVAVVSPAAADSVTVRWDGEIGDTVREGLSADGRSHTVVVEGYGCQEEYTYRIADPPTMALNKEAVTVLCTDSCSGSIHLSYGYPGRPVGDTLLTRLCEGLYPLTVTDPNGCPYYDTTEIIRDHRLDHFEAWADDTLLFIGEGTTLHATHISGAAYLWEPAATLSNPFSPDPTALPIDTLTEYRVEVVDGLGCRGSDTVCLHCTPVDCSETSIFIPNAFSPNGDGKNDRLCCEGEYIIEYQMDIFNRWGERVFESSSLSDCWDGTYQGKPCLPGVYTYTCHIRCEGNHETRFKGDITLIR